ncbi:MAG: Uma2 family endonuclease [Pseudonocardiales bacterium]|nr:Uma2 family endonuclease [Pseudonocardiales bacterium]
MTAAEPLGVPGRPPARLLTAAEYAQLGETGWGYTELLDGRILVSPSPSPKHNMAGLTLAMQMVPQLPEGLRVIQDVDIDLGLAPADQPGWVRRPDLVVIDTVALNRVDRDGGLLRAADVLIVVEIVSPGSGRLDYVIKRDEYADAGIPHYWIVDLDEPVSLLDCHLAEDFGYDYSGTITAVFTTSVPFPLRLALDVLIGPG